jgi:hypothetical protein
VTFRGLGFDPTPGSVDAVSAVVAQLRAALDALSTADTAVRTASRHVSSWQGEAADAFRSRAALSHDPAPLRAAIPVLEAWAETLAAGRRRAEELDARALRLRRALNDARDVLQDKQNERDLAATPVAGATAAAAVTMATERVVAAESALEAVLTDARVLARDHLRAADEAAAALGAAPVTDRPALQAVTSVLHRSSRTAAALAGLLAPSGRNTSAAGAAGAVAEAVARRAPGTGEMIELGAR